MLANMRQLDVAWGESVGAGLNLDRERDRFLAGVIEMAVMVHHPWPDDARRTPLKMRHGDSELQWKSFPKRHGWPQLSPQCLQEPAERNLRSAGSLIDDGSVHSLNETSRTVAEVRIASIGSLDGVLASAQR